METNYNWTISALDCKVKEGTLENVVNVVHWRLSASNDNFTAETYSATAMPSPSGDNFTTYNDLTKEQVVQWLETILDLELIEIKNRLIDNLFLLENPIQVTPQLPFNN
jgi:hypothetical protein